MQESEEEGEEKGLFTFYKEQQMQEDLLRINFKKKGKNKNRKSKRRIKSQMKASESKVFVINEDNQEEKECEEHPKQAFEQFLKNIRHHSPQLSKSTNCRKPNSNRLKTEPNASSSAKQGSLKGIQKTKVLTELSQKYNFLPPREFSPLSQPHFTPVSELINCQQRFCRDFPIHSEINSNKIHLQQEKRRLLERLQSLQVKNKSNLISSRDSINLRDSSLNQKPGTENKHFFNEVILNENADKNAYKLLKEALKLPQIKRQNEQSQQMIMNSSRKRLAIAAKNMPYQRKQLRLKHSNDRRREFYKLNLMAELTESKSIDGPTINLIDMSKDYKREDTNCQEWNIKRKLIRNKLGVEL